MIFMSFAIFFEAINEKFLRAPEKKSLRLSNQLCINIFLQCFVFMKYWPHHLIMRVGKKYQKEAIFHSNYYLLWISFCMWRIYALMMPHNNFLISHHNWKDFYNSGFVFNLIFECSTFHIVSLSLKSLRITYHRMSR